MKNMAKPIRSTIVWGLLSGLVYAPLSIALSWIAPWPLSLQLLLWMLLVGYGVLLSRWASKPLFMNVLPLFLLLIAAFLIPSTTIFLFAALGTLGWMRSAICFNQTPVLRRIGVEMGLGIAACLPVSAVLPSATLSGALGVWLFFLIQALYFVVFEFRNEPVAEFEVDSFERAKMAAEQILSG